MGVFSRCADCGTDFVGPPGVCGRCAGKSGDRRPCVLCGKHGARVTGCYECAWEDGFRAGLEEMRKELEATKRALDRWQTGTQIEGDYVRANGDVVTVPSGQEKDNG